MSAVAFQPESLESMRARYNKAIAKPFTTDNHAQEMFELGRRHVFDFEDGVRLLVRRQLAPSGVTYLTVSIGAAHESAQFPTLLDAAVVGIDHFRELSQLKGCPLPVGLLTTGKTIAIYFQEDEGAQ